MTREEFAKGLTQTSIHDNAKPITTVRLEGLVNFKHAPVSMATPVYTEFNYTSRAMMKNPDGVAEAFINVIEELYLKIEDMFPQGLDDVEMVRLCPA